eukprot:TRINITY_DN26071_c0_g1_i1.p1 TRINITY_DN26071_c0_g1~~TRINITY_DN26071_c0_g1_i1.p1  ORF type:complete len:234 (-),score=43.38 TRINITY_DN26071_c0_g1_i1:25-726(-)
MKVIGIVGGSGSGKSTLSRHLQNHFQKSGRSCAVLPLDSFFRDYADTPSVGLPGFPAAWKNFETPEALDLDSYARSLRELKQQGATMLWKRVWTTPLSLSKKVGEEELRVEPGGVILAEGFHLLTSDPVSSQCDLIIFLECNFETIWTRRSSQNSASTALNQLHQKLEEFPEEYDYSMSNRTYFEEVVLSSYKTWIEPKKKDAHLVITTDLKTEQEILSIALAFLEERGVTKQ